MKLVVCLHTLFLMPQFGLRKSNSTNNAVAYTIHSMVGYLNCDMTGNFLNPSDGLVCGEHKILRDYHNEDT